MRSPYSGVSQGAVNAIALADVLVANNHNVVEASDTGETNQLRFGTYFKDMGVLGDRSRFAYGKQRIKHST